MDEDDLLFLLEARIHSYEKEEEEVQVLSPSRVLMSWRARRKERVVTS